MKRTTMPQLTFQGLQTGVNIDGLFLGLEINHATITHAANE